MTRSQVSISARTPSRSSRARWAAGPASWSAGRSP